MRCTGWFWEHTRPMNRTTWLLQESRFPMMISLILRSTTVRKEVGVPTFLDYVLAVALLSVLSNGILTVC